jgi:ketosteroid isomerase-like protein
LKKTIVAFIVSTFAFFAAAPGFANGLTPQDYTEIEQLYAKYNWAIDSGDAQAWADTFVEDGVFNNFKGQEQLKGFVNRWVNDMNGLTRKHWISNLSVTGDGKTAQGKVYLLLVDVSGQQPTIITSASYSDELVKTSEGWRFSKRATKSDRPAQ